MKAQPKKSSFKESRKNGAGGVPSLKNSRPERVFAPSTHPRMSADFNLRSSANFKPPVRKEPRPWFQNFFFWSCFLFLAVLIAAPLVYVKSKSPSTDTSKPPAPAEKGVAAPKNNSTPPPDSAKPEEKKEAESNPAPKPASNEESPSKSEKKEAEKSPGAPPEKPVPQPPPKSEKSPPQKPQKTSAPALGTPPAKPEISHPSEPIKTGEGKSETSGLSLTREEILLLEVLRARESGNLKLAKAKVLEWLKLSPNSRDAKRLLAEINAALNSR
jgi:cytoskeletal protein RodZ